MIIINTLKCTSVSEYLFYFMIMSRRNINRKCLKSIIWNDYCRWGIWNELKKFEYKYFFDSKSKLANCTRNGNLLREKCNQNQILNNVTRYSQAKYTYSSRKDGSIPIFAVGCDGDTIKIALRLLFNYNGLTAQTTTRFVLRTQWKKIE